MTTGAQHLLSFIRGEIDELNDESNKCNNEFVEVRPHKQQNGGIDDEDIIDWVKRMNPSLEFGYYKLNCSMYEMNANLNGRITIIRCRGHMWTIYANNGILENYDTSRWQNTANNCTLYAGIVAIIRPLVDGSREMRELMLRINDKEGTESCERVAKISKYYFGRGEEWFKFPSRADVPVKM